MKYYDIIFIAKNMKRLKSLPIGKIVEIILLK